MEVALIDNKPEFIQFLIENNLNLGNFLTKGRLLFLYNCDKVSIVLFYFLLKIILFIRGTKRFV